MEKIEVEKRKPKAEPEKTEWPKWQRLLVASSFSLLLTGVFMVLLAKADELGYVKTRVDISMFNLLRKSESTANPANEYERREEALIKRMRQLEAENHALKRRMQHTDKEVSCISRNVDEC